MEIKWHGVLLELGDEPLEFSGIRAARRRLLYSSASPTGQATMLIHVARPVIMTMVAVIGVRTLSSARWRQTVGTLQAMFCIFDMAVLPVARQHATLYTNLMISAQLLCSSIWPAGAWLMHGAAFTSAHSLLLGYIMVLYAAGDSMSISAQLADGFDIVDITQWVGNSHVPGATPIHLRTVAMACEASFVLHAIPLLLVHLDLAANKASLALAYQGAALRSHAWSMLSAFVLPLTYQVVVTSSYGSLEVALNTLYRIKLSSVDTLIACGQVMNLSVATLATAYVSSTLKATREMKAA